MRRSFAKIFANHSLKLHQQKFLSGCISANPSTIFGKDTYKLTLAHPFSSNSKSYRIALFWTTFCLLCLRPSKVQENMRLEGDTEVHIQNVLAMMEGHKAVIDGYLSGEWTLEAQPQPPPAVAAASMAGPRQENELDVEQNVVLNAIKDMVMWALERRYPEDVTAEELEQFMKKPLQQAPRQMRPLCVLGPAGSGKSTAVQVAIRRAAAAGAHIGIACPTGVLASTYREQFPDLDVDTLHGMFLLHLPENQAYDTMSSFDFIVIDEVGQLSQETFERLMRLWDNAERRPALVFVGHFHQLRGMDTTRATDSARWRQVVQRHLRAMRRCQCQSSGSWSCCGRPSHPKTNCTGCCAATAPCQTEAQETVRSQPTWTCKPC